MPVEGVEHLLPRILHPRLPTIMRRPLHRPTLRATVTSILTGIATRLRVAVQSLEAAAAAVEGGGASPNTLTLSLSGSDYVRF